MSQCATQTILDSSAGVRISLSGHVTSAQCMGTVMTSSMTHVDASMPFQMMDSSANQSQESQVKDKIMF